MKIARKIAIHEAGHAAVADALGFRVLSVAMKDGQLQCAIVAEEDSSSPMEQFLLATFSLAGGCAAHRGRFNEEYDFHESMKIDLDAAYKSCEVYAGAMKERFDEAINRATWLAQSIVNDRWKAIEKLADHIEQNGAATEEDIKKILREYRKGASIRDDDGNIRPKKREDIWEKCIACNGSGWKAGDDCTRCAGSGEVETPP